MNAPSAKGVAADLEAMGGRRTPVQSMVIELMEMAETVGRRGYEGHTLSAELFRRCELLEATPCESFADVAALAIGAEAMGDAHVRSGRGAWTAPEGLMAHRAASEGMRLIKEAGMSRPEPKSGCAAGAACIRGMLPGDLMACPLDAPWGLAEHGSCHITVDGLKLFVTTALDRHGRDEIVAWPAVMTADCRFVVRASSGADLRWRVGVEMAGRKAAVPS